MKKQTFKPLSDFILVKREETQDKSEGGIYIPDSAKKETQRGTVLRVGPGKYDEHGKFIAMQTKIGDQIVFGKYSGVDVKLNDEELLIMHETEVFAVIN